MTTDSSADSGIFFTQNRFKIGVKIHLKIGSVNATNYYSKEKGLI
jgi:hypothetical protein